MARIRATRRKWNTLVTVTGCLRGSDMRRLEHACSATLTSAHLALVIDLTRVSEIDAAGQGFLEKLRSRGAVIRHRENVGPVSDSSGPSGVLRAKRPH
jgi:anti-anti-sigma regulatory factor